MKKLFSIVVLFVSVLCSCTKVINLDLNDSDPQTVIEGSIGTIGDSTIVKITKSINFDNSNNFPFVNGALVIISDDIGNTETLQEKSSGIYSSASFIGVSGRKYKLEVNENGKLFSSSSILPTKVNFDSLTVTKATVTGGGGPGGGGQSGTTYKVTVQFKDPSIETNYYRFIEYHNNAQQNSVFIFDDRLTNGQSISTDLMSFNRKLKTGDTLTIEMQCIDKPVYDYLKSFANLGGGPQNSSTPANPYTNIVGSKLGYFSAHTTQRKTLVIQ